MARSISRSFLITVLFFCLSHLTSALEVAVNSPCSQKCIDDPVNGDKGNRSHSLTFHRNLACFDDEYEGNNATKVGKKFADCQSCMKTSGYQDEKFGERDTFWFMFNSKATVDWCIFGRFAEEHNDDISSSYIYQQCNSACQSIYPAIDFNVKSDAVSYNFCDYDGNFTEDAEQCKSCLYEADGLTILGNVLTTVQDLCRQKPGKQYSFEANIFTASRIELSSATTSVPLASATSPGQNGTAQTSTSKADSGISKGAIAGIVLGALVAIALVLGGILVVLRRLRKRREATEMPKEMHGNGNYAGAHGPVTQQNGKYAYQQVGSSGGSGVGVAGRPVEMGTHGEIGELHGDPHVQRY